ncbi:hypothetical protein AMAG_13918 [Allomyces macrogynus ATCC 38327]|uniref:PSI domain-containing protein n=1 Tax=Allomyces macrogynus (strain ATCC 38327) TaxID=578462 RepID=A0A0L0T310_ALLM3|nr:hypothetical protein AMAG_13918 [Allomyces macrogynus ATCC 38327]|eukprot:KNE69045.1 hypothetical protein AMAG_13918 [Allomyces macrogynus ATCC 38327]
MAPFLTTLLLAAATTITSLYAQAASTAPAPTFTQGPPPPSLPTPGPSMTVVCSTLTGLQCGLCVSMDGCGWCASTSQCVPATVWGAANSGVCPQGGFQYKTCVVNLETAWIVVIAIVVLLAVAVPAGAILWRRRLRQRMRLDRTEAERNLTQLAAQLKHKYSTKKRGNWLPLVG